MRSLLALGLSLALTGALLVMNYALFRSHGGISGFGEERKVIVTAKRLVRQTQPAPAPAASPTNAPSFHWSALESADYAVYAANLRAVGCPERTLRDILLPDIEKFYEEREHKMREPAEDTFWQTSDQRDALQRQREAKARALTLEKRALIQRLLGAELSYQALKELRTDNMTSGIVDLLLGFLEVAKSDQLFTVHKLREEDARDFLTAVEGILLDEEIPQLQAVRDRYERELGAALRADEFEELRLRLAVIGGEQKLSRRAGVNVTGAELREIYRLYTDTHDVFAKTLNLEGEIYPEGMQEKGDAAFQELLRRFLGPERFADAERAQDGLFRELFESTENRGVSKAALVQAYEARRAAAAQAAQILGDAQLSADERALLLAALRAQTTQALARSLGPVGFDAYMKTHGQQLTNSLSLPVTQPPAGLIRVK